MARIRTVKPEFWQSESLASLDPMTRLLAIGLLNHADDEGFFRATPALIRAAVFPFDDSANIPGMLQELSFAGYLSIGTASNGRKYGHIINFLKHQRVDKPKASEIKDLCDFVEQSEIIPRIVQDASKGERKGKEQGKEQGKEMEGKGIASATAPASSVFPKLKSISRIDFSKWPSLPSESTMQQWLEVRKRKKATNTQIAMDAICHEVIKAETEGIDAEYCIRLAVEKSWSGFKLDWLKNECSVVPETSNNLIDKLTDRTWAEQ